MFKKELMFKILGKKGFFLNIRSFLNIRFSYLRSSHQLDLHHHRDHLHRLSTTIIGSRVDDSILAKIASRSADRLAMTVMEILDNINLTTPKVNDLYQDQIETSLFNKNAIITRDNYS